MVEFHFNRKAYEGRPVDLREDAHFPVHANRPGLVRPGLMAPGMEGWEHLEELRRDEAGRAMPVIVVTARALSAEDRRQLNAQVQRILAKRAYSREVLLAEERARVAASAGRGRATEPT